MFLGRRGKRRLDPGQLIIPGFTLSHGGFQLAVRLLAEFLFRFKACIELRRLLLVLLEFGSLFLKGRRLLCQAGRLLFDRRRGLVFVRQLVREIPADRVFQACLAVLEEPLLSDYASVDAVSIW